MESLDTITALTTRLNLMTKDVPNATKSIVELKCESEDAGHFYHLELRVQVKGQIRHSFFSGGDFMEVMNEAFRRMENILEDLRPKNTAPQALPNRLPRQANHNVNPHSKAA